MSLPQTLEDMTRTYWYASIHVRRGHGRDHSHARRALYHVAANAPAGGKLQDRSVHVIGIIEGVTQDGRPTAGEI